MVVVCEEEELIHSSADGEDGQVQTWQVSVTWKGKGVYRTGVDKQCLVQHGLPLRQMYLIYGGKAAQENYI